MLLHVVRDARFDANRRLIYCAVSLSKPLFRCFVPDQPRITPSRPNITEKTVTWDVKQQKKCKLKYMAFSRLWHDLPTSVNDSSHHHVVGDSLFGHGVWEFSLWSMICEHIAEEGDADCFFFIFTYLSSVCLFCVPSSWWCNVLACGL